MKPICCSCGTSYIRFSPLFAVYIKEHIIFLVKENAAWSCLQDLPKLTITAVAVHCLFKFFFKAPTSKLEKGFKMYILTLMNMKVFYCHNFVASVSYGLAIC